MTSGPPLLINAFFFGGGGGMSPWAPPPPPQYATGRQWPLQWYELWQSFWLSLHYPVPRKGLIAGTLDFSHTSTRRYQWRHGSKNKKPYMYMYISIKRANLYVSNIQVLSKYLAIQCSTDCPPKRINKTITNHQHFSENPTNLIQ